MRILAEIERAVDAVRAAVLDDSLVVLQDDKSYFPVYNPCVVVRQETLTAFPEIAKIFAPLSQKLDTKTITELNFQVDGEKKAAKDVAREWLTKQGML